jgi:H+-transporting ATPase
MPFDPTIKRTEATVIVKSQKFKVTKGAPHVILKLLDQDKLGKVVDVSGAPSFVWMDGWQTS